MALNVNVNSKVSKNAGSAIRRAQRKRIKDSAQVGSQIAQEHAPEDRGTLKQSRIDPEWRGESLVWGYDSPHARPQEFGTDEYYPPLKPLLEWSERVSGGKGLGFYVARHKIPEEGIEEKRFVRRGRDRQVSWLKSNTLGDYLEREL